jgi:uncharacterized membrane protein
MSVRHKPRHALHGLIGLMSAAAAALLAPADLGPLVRMALGFDVGALVYLAIVWTRLLRAGEQLSQAAEEEEESHFALTVIIAGVALAGLSGVVALATHVHSPLHLLIGVATIGLSWLLLQTVFAAHYASQYRADSSDNDPNNGLDFPGGGPIKFLDFAYVAFTVGLTFQVSDVTTNTPGMRRLVMAQALIAFIFNTTVIAIAVGVATSWF